MSKFKRRTAVEIAELRENPEMFEVELPHEDGTSSTRVWFRRPIKPTDEIVVKLDDESITKLVEFIAERGVTRDELLEKRSWRGSGKKGVWTARKKLKGVNDGRVADDSDVGDDVDPLDLPDADDADGEPDADIGVTHA